MTEKDLSKYYKFRKEAEDLENRLLEFGDGVKSNQIKDVVVSSSGVKMSIQEQRQQLFDLYMEKRVSALEECIKIERYIDSVDDPEIRTIMRTRFIDLKSWEEIGEIVHMERTAVSKKFRRYINAKQ